MINDDIRNLRAGDVIRETINGRECERELTDVRFAVQCENKRSGANGHWACGVECESGTGNGWYSWSIFSDEYLQGEGYHTHVDGVRIRGAVVVHKATDAEHEAAKLRSMNARQK